MRNTDEAIHNAPYGAKQPDEGGNGADRRQITVASSHVAAHRCDATFQTEAGTFFNPFVIFAALREFQFILRFIDELCAEAFALKPAAMSEA